MSFVCNFVLAPIIVSLLFPIHAHSQTWEKVSAGGEFSVALKSDGTLWAWGSNMNGQLGIDSQQQSFPTPKQIGVDTDWADVAAGGFHIIALKENGTLWAWGSNSVGQVGIPENSQFNKPRQIGSDNNWMQIDAGFATSAAIKADGSLWMWGINTMGTLGIGTEQNMNIPVKVVGTQTWKKVACGGLHTIAIASDNTLWGWGFGGNGQVGHNS